MRSLRNIRSLAIAATVCIAACGSCDDTTEDNNLANNNTGEGSNNQTTSNSNRSNNPNNGGDNNDLIDQTRDEYCMGDGPPIIVGDQGNGREAVCTGDLAQTTFRYGVCVCQDFEIGNTIMTDGFDSNIGPASQNDRGGAVGVNGDFSVGNSATVGGTLWVAGAGGVDAGNGLTVNQRLYSGGDVGASTLLSVVDDAHVVGDISANQVTVGGTLHQPAASSINANNEQIAQRIEQTVSVPDPCECDAIFDISAFAANHRDNNHNADIGLDPGLIAAGGSSVTIDLPCGVFYLDGGRVDNALTFNVTGRTALFIGGDLDVGNSILANVEDGSEFDLFVEGNVTVGNSMSIGSVDRPASARMYVGGTSVDMGNGGQFAGNLYAPRATVTVGNSVEIFGSMFVGEFDGGNSFIVHYDAAVLTAADDCETNGGGSGGDSNNGDGGMCSTCEDCGNQACNDGVCGECSTDTDCCSPLICFQGECILVIP